ncbi:MAG: T9SS type A sorting domain-containing protein [Bacteroidota bacterium]
MKKDFTKVFILSLSMLFSVGFSSAQNGLERVIVEKYYISNKEDSIASSDNAGGILPVGSVTYRIFLDMKQGYKFKMAYGSSTHELFMKTSTTFFNNEDRGGISPNFTKAQAKNNTVMLDSWLSAGAACIGNFGILKSDDDGVSTVVNADNILANDSVALGIPLTVQDGFIAGAPGEVGTLGMDTITPVIDALSQVGGSLSVSNGAWYCLSGATGYDSTNKVLIAQITTDGVFSFELNIQLQTPDFAIEKYVAKNPLAAEIVFDSLTYSSIDTTTNGIKNNFNKKPESVVSIFPNPTNDSFTLSINSLDINSNCYYTVYNVIGNVIFKKKIENTSANYKELIDMKNQSKGMYFVEVSIDGKKSTNKLIKQ